MLSQSASDPGNLVALGGKRMDLRPCTPVQSVVKEVLPTTCEEEIIGQFRYPNHSCSYRLHYNHTLEQVPVRKFAFGSFLRPGNNDVVALWAPNQKTYDLKSALQLTELHRPIASAKSFSNQNWQFPETNT